MRSVCDKRFEVTETCWVVSLLNVIGDTTAAGMNPFVGHSVIYVEGIEGVGPGISDRRQIKGYYDVLASSTDAEESVITEVRIRENEACTRDVSRHSAKSFYAKPESVRQMIAAIKADQELVRQSQSGTGVSIKYRAIRFAWSDNTTVNCTSWCAGKIKIATGEDFLGKKPKVAGGCVIS